MTRASGRSPTFTPRARAFPALADLLSRNANVDRRHHADRLARLADAHRLQLGDAAGAVEWYGRALDVAPGQEVARAGLQALLADASIGPEAARRLAAAAAKPDSWPDSWQLLLDLVPLRLAGGDRSRRARPDPRGRRDLRRHARGRSEARARVAVRGAAARGHERPPRARAAAPRRGDRRLRGAGPRDRRDDRGRRRAAADARAPARAARPAARGAHRRSRPPRARATQPRWR